MIMTNIVARAETFIWSNARLLERQLFAYHFHGGSREAVLAALRAYQNEDGGFGQALEPDIRCPDSQPVPVQHALEILDAVGLDAEMVRSMCDFLTTITTAEGGVPFVLPSAREYPHAPWWDTSDEPPASLNPTAAIVGLLCKLGVDHPWLKPATAYCWERITALQPSEMHEMGVAITFLRYTLDRRRAERQLERLGQQLLTSGLVADISATDYVRKPLDWAPTPDHPLRSLFDAATIQANLDVLIAGQQPDGGWSISWQPLSPGCELEWRGWVTLAALQTLQANGRLAE
jgi:hypothetical protein